MNYKAEASASARKLAKAIRSAGRRPTAIAYITSVGTDSDGLVVSAVGTVQNLENVNINVGRGSAIGKHSTVMVEDHGTAVAPDWRATGVQGHTAASPYYINDSGGNPIINPAGVVASAPNLLVNGGFDLKHNNIPLGWRSSEQARVAESMGED